MLKLPNLFFETFLPTCHRFLPGAFQILKTLRTLGLLLNFFANAFDAHFSQNIGIDSVPEKNVADSRAVHHFVVNLLLESGSERNSPFRHALNVWICAQQRDLFFTENFLAHCRTLSSLPWEQLYQISIPFATLHFEIRPQSGAFHFDSVYF